MCEIIDLAYALNFTMKINRKSFNEENNHHNNIIIIE